MKCLLGFDYVNKSKSYWCPVSQDEGEMSIKWWNAHGKCLKQSTCSCEHKILALTYIQLWLISGHE